MDSSSGTPAGHGGGEHGVSRRDLRRSRRRRPRVLPWTAGGLAVLLAGYAAADAFDVVPGVLTLDEPIEVQALPRPAAEGSGADPAAQLPADAPVPRDIAEALDPILDADELTGPAGVDIRDALTGDVLYTRSADEPRTPASVTKVLTAAAALSELGADAQFTTTAVLAPGGASGSGTVHLVGGGDVLLGTGESEPSEVIGHAGLGSLAQQTAESLAASGVSEVELVADLSRYEGPAFNDGWERVDIGNGYIAPIVPLMANSGYVSDETGSSRHEDPAAAALDAFASALEDAGITVETGDPAPAPDGSEELGSVDSAPLSAIVRHLLLASDNVVSEAVGREVAIARGEPGSAAQSPAAVVAALADAGLETGSIDLVDTSGLDYGNRISPHDLTVIVQAAASSDGDLSQLIPSFPVGGLSGTLFDRYLDDATDGAAGRVSAKTGSLNTVSSLAGSVVTADGRLLVFSMMSDDLTPGTAGGARQVMDRAVTALAGCGCS